MRYLWPVFGFNAVGSLEWVATFFEERDAASFIRHPLECGAFEHRHLYEAPPKDDPRLHPNRVGPTETRE